MSQTAVIHNKWRISASLLLVSKSQDSSNYNLLMLKRSERTTKILNQTVFPGGLLDIQADESVDWLKYFEEFGVSQEALRRLVLIRDDRPSILAPQGTGCYDRFFKRSSIWAREITLRLTALRECFEEVGILLCRSGENLDYGEIAMFRELPDLEYWQKRVHNKPSDFLELCRVMKVVPDLWALHEWSAWASPAAMGKGYQTAFYMAFVDSQPGLHIEPSEVKDALWLSPKEFLQNAKLGELWFLPPQVYELSRLMSITDYHTLLDFACQRSQMGTTLYMPVIYKCKDNWAYILPGDDFYPPEPHLAEKVIELPDTVEELRARFQRVHRYYNYRPYSLDGELNFPPLHGHLIPHYFTHGLQKL